MIKIGDILTVDREIIGNDGKIIFEENQKVEVRDVWVENGRWSNLCPDIWIKEKINGIMLVNVYGIWFPTMFKELKKETILN